MAQNLEALETPIGIMQPIERDSNKQLIFTTYESINNETLFTDLTGASIEFELRKTKDGVANFKKKNLLAGGSDSEILILTSSTFKLYLIPGDTKDLSEYTYWGRFKITASGGAIYIIWIRIPFI